MLEPIYDECRLFDRKPFIEHAKKRLEDRLNANMDTLERHCGISPAHLRLVKAMLSLRRTRDGKYWGGGNNIQLFGMKGQFDTACHPGSFIELPRCLDTVLLTLSEWPAGLYGERIPVGACRIGGLMWIIGVLDFDDRLFRRRCEEACPSKCKPEFHFAGFDGLERFAEFIEFLADERNYVPRPSGKKARIVCPDPYVLDGKRMLERFFGEDGNGKEE